MRSPGTGALYDGFGDPVTVLEIHTGTTSNWNARYQDGSGAGGGNNVPGFGRFGFGESPAVAGVWTHVAMTWNTSGDLVLYVNCQEADRVSMAAGSFDGLATTERFIGPESAATRFWNGLIDDIQIYNTALDRDEIERIAQLCPAVGQAAPAGVPTLSEWAMVLLAALLAWYATTPLRRRAG
jgi:hypothetical protein